MKEFIVVKFNQIFGFIAIYRLISSIILILTPTLLSINKLLILLLNRHIILLAKNNCTFKWIE